MTFLSLILAYNLIKLTTVLFNFTQGQLSLFVMVISAITVNLLITGSIAFLGFAYPTSSLLPDAFYRIRNQNFLKKIYSVLGVEIFKYLLLLTFYRKKDNKKYFNGTKSGIMEFDYNTRQSEFGHLFAFFIIEIFAVIFLFNGHSIIFFLIQPINLVLNFYPIILQRAHRIKTEKIIKRILKKNI